MAVRFDELVNDMVNIGFGAAAMAADKSREVLEDLNARGEAARNDVEASDYFHLSTPDYSAAALAASDYIWDNVPSSYTSDEPLPADVAAGAAAAFTSALESSSERELYLYVDLMGTADADGENVQLKFDRNAWEETFRTSVMGMY